MDPHDKSDIEDHFRQIDALLTCGIFAPQNCMSPLYKAAFVDMLICLRDLMYKAEKYAKRIDFTDDIISNGNVKDVTSLIKYVRDAMCHPDSDNHYIDAHGGKATFNVQYGKGVMLQVGDFVQKSDYEDEVCFFFGAQQIYLRRHILRALDEAKRLLTPLVSPQRS